MTSRTTYADIIGKCPIVSVGLFPVITIQQNSLCLQALPATTLDAQLLPAPQDNAHTGVSNLSNTFKSITYTFSIVDLQEFLEAKPDLPRRTYTLQDGMYITSLFVFLIK
jgi:hypothetical protein